mgnify:CR=1 FL=1
MCVRSPRAGAEVRLTTPTSRQSIPRLPLLLPLALLLLPLVGSLLQPLGEDIAPRVEAASDCTLSSDRAEWHEEVSSFNLSGLGNEWGVMDEDDDGFKEEEDGFDGGFFPDAGDGIYNDSTLKAFTQSFHSSMIVGNDTSGGLRLNLTVGYRYTFCVVVSSLNQSSYLDAPLVDVYLLHQFDWERYRADYEMREWEGRDLLNQIPPQWRAIGAWMPYRDVHSYESLRAVDFTISLDHDETTSSLFDPFTEQQWMYLVIDGWDNARDGDTPAPNRDFAVDITVMSEERIVIPNYTVALFCCGLIGALIMLPVVLHSRFSSAGRGVSTSNAERPAELMPMLEIQATKPSVGIDVPHQPPPPPS